ncbi:ABC transporter permease, partial [Burkholderia multivorans]
MSAPVKILPVVLGRRTVTSPSSLLVMSSFFACATLFLTVAAGAWMFFQIPPIPEAEGIDGMYKFLAAFATVLL